MSDESILYKVGEIPIRRVNHVRLTYGEQEYKKIAEIATKCGIPISVVIALMCQPCSCGITSVNITIPKGVLSIKKANAGRSLINRIENDKQK